MIAGVHYAVYVEYGTRFSGAQPFLGPAANKHEPTLAANETYRDLPAVADVDADKLAERGYGYVRLDQLAIEHILGAR